MLEHNLHKPVMTPLDLPSFDILEAAFDDEEEALQLAAPYLPSPSGGTSLTEDESLYDPLPMNYIAEDTEPLILSSPISNVAPEGTGKVQPSFFWPAVSFSAEEQEMADYTQALSKIAPPETTKTTTSKTPKKKKPQTRKSKPRTKEVELKGLVKPQKPVGAYGIYLQHQRVKLFSTTDANFDDMDLAISLQWKRLDADSAKYYHELAVKEKDEYQKAMVEYRKKRRSLLKKKSSTAAKTKDPKTPPPLIVEPTLVTPYVSSGDLSYQNNVDALSDLAEKLGYQATQDLIKMFA